MIWAFNLFPLFRSKHFPLSFDSVCADFVDAIKMRISNLYIAMFVCGHCETVYVVVTKSTLDTTNKWGKLATLLSHSTRVQ